MPASSSAAELFNASSLALIGELHLRFEPQLQHLLEARSDRQSALDSGAWPTSLPSGDEQEWEVPRIPQDLRDRRVELHCDANDSKFVQAFETAASTLLVDLAELLPVPAGALLAQRTLRDTLRDRTGADGKTVVFGPRNLGAHETMLSWGTNAAHAALVDIALYLQNNAVISEVLGLRLGQLESVAEAELWRDIFGFLEAKGVVSPGQIKATLAVESVPALFDIDSIMRALGNYTVALGLDHHACMGSFVRSFRCYPQFILPDRNELTDDVHFLRSWNILLVQHAHRHGA
ncbi:MAG: hypothetical protein KDI09_14655, partial [Halioglobus sp.]|nr:hypothetical protein [Halioglobus sp.]